MWNRSAAVSPATARLERWKIARRYAARATPHTAHARLTAASASVVAIATAGRVAARSLPLPDRPHRTGRRGPALGSPGDQRLSEHAAAGSVNETHCLSAPSPERIPRALSVSSPIYGRWRHERRRPGLLTPWRGLAWCLRPSGEAPSRPR